MKTACEINPDKDMIKLLHLKSPVIHYRVSVGRSNICAQTTTEHTHVYFHVLRFVFVYSYLYFSIQIQYIAWEEAACSACTCCGPELYFSVFVVFVYLFIKFFVYIFVFLYYRCICALVFV